MTMSSSMAVVTTKLEGRSSSPAAAYVAKPPPPPPGLSFHDDNKTAVAGYYESYNGSSAPPRPPAEHQRHQQQAAAEQEKAVDGIVLALRGAAALAAFVAVALVASCRHGDWMEFGRYQEYRYLVGASAVACVYSAAQALRNFRRMRAGRCGGSGGLLDFAGDQAVAYLLVTAASAALPITIRMRSAVINIFTDAITAAIGLAFVAFAALAFSAMLSAFRLRPPY